MPFENPNIKHHNQAEKDIKNISVLYAEVVASVILALKPINSTFNKTTIFKFKDFKQLEYNLNKKLKIHASKITVLIDKGVDNHWNYSNKKNNKIFKDVLKTPFPEEVIPTRNLEGLNAFKKRKGRKLSKRVWKQTEQMKQELEMAIDCALKKGTPANQLAKELQKHLNEPNKMFKRYKDNNGQLQLSKNAKAYKPGQGVYRSSFKNAQRLARTEINKAYRMADLAKFNSNPAIIGYEIKRSKHPYPCKTCDLMAGKYPNTFVWSGNHPNCRCYITPILAKDFDFIKSQNHYIQTGEYLKHKNIEVINPKLTKWIKENKKKLKATSKRGTLPDYISDNFKI